MRRRCLRAGRAFVVWAVSVIMNGKKRIRGGYASTVSTNRKHGFHKPTPLSIILKLPTLRAAEAPITGLQPDGMTDAVKWGPMRAWEAWAVPAGNTINRKET